jgi:putative ABC transport system permease protein
VAIDPSSTDVVHFDGDTVTVVGILPPTFGRTIPVWRALQVPANRQNRRGSGWTVIGRLMPGYRSSRGEIAAQLPRRSRELRRHPTYGCDRCSMDPRGLSHHSDDHCERGGVHPLDCLRQRRGVILARGASRQEEIAVRVALGASRQRLFGQLLVESLTLSMAGGGGPGGLGLAALTIQTIVANIPIELPGDAPAQLNGFVLAATMGVALLNGVLFGVVPALRASRSSSRQRSPKLAGSMPPACLAGEGNS